MASNEFDLKGLTTSHEAKLQQLRTSHQAELQELKFQTSCSKGVLLFVIVSHICL